MDLLYKYHKYESALDLTLELFDEGVSYDYFLSTNPPNSDEIVSFLVAEQYLEKNKFGVHITYKGRLHLKNGGFVGEFRRRIVGRIIAVVTLIAAIATLILEIFSQAT